MKVMEAIADALETPLPLLLESTDLDREALAEIAGHPFKSSVPPGYERISVVLPSHKAFIVKKWGDDTRKKAAWKALTPRVRACTSFFSR